MQFLEKLGSGLMATEPLTHIQRNGRRYSDQAQALLKRNTGEIKARPSKALVCIVE